MLRPICCLIGSFCRILMIFSPRFLPILVDDAQVSAKKVISPDHPIVLKYSILLIAEQAYLLSSTIMYKEKGRNVV